MMDAITPIDATRAPVVRITDTGEAMADSRDVAAYFGKNHFDVLRALRNLQCSDSFRERNFASFKIKDLTGEATSHVMMTKDGFTFLVMGFTGGRAATYKERYIAQFNVMESQLRRQAPAFTIPATYAEALRLAADQSERLAQQEAQIATLVPKGDFFDRFVDANGLYGYQNAGRALNCRPNLFTRWLRQKYCFYAGDALVPYQQYLQAGLFEVKNFIGDDGKARPRGWITPKGLEYFSSRVPEEIKCRPAVAVAVSKSEAA